MNVKLEEAWKGGMKYAGKRCKDEIEEVANSLAISTERVKEWIGNRNAKERRENGEGKPMKRKAAITTGTNSYALFAKTVKRGTMDGPTYCKHIANEWGKLDEREKEVFREDAQQIRLDPYKGKPREAVISAQLNIIGQACQTLDSIGYAVCGLGCDREKEAAPDFFGTQDAAPFFDFDLQEKFILFVSGKKIKATKPDQTICNEEEKKELRQLVRKHFNAAWAISTKLATQVPYKEITAGNILVEVEGLPEGITLKDPSSYGKETLKELLKTEMKFQIRNKELTEDVVNSNGDTVENKASISGEDVEKRKSKGKSKGDVKKRNLERESNGVSKSNVFEKPGCSTDVNKRKKEYKKSNGEGKKEKQKPVESQRGAELSSEDVEMLSPLLLDESTQELVNPTEDELFAIENVLKTRVRRGKTEALIKWEGFAKPTWEPQTNIKNNVSL
ncbi:uncharacterized protein LOC143080738 isoform X1 [Mytilus galloprovincialis]